MAVKERGVADEFGFSGFVQVFFLSLKGPRSYTISYDGVDTHIGPSGRPRYPG